MNPIITLPATCELCGNWLPGHSLCTSCPRNGVHPSQWSLGIDELLNNQEDSINHQIFANGDGDDALLLLNIHNNNDAKELVQQQEQKISF